MSGALSVVGINPFGVSLTHRALFYGSEEEFLAGLVPFVRDGLERGDPIRVATTDRHASWLRAALGKDAGYVSFDDRHECYRHPVRSLAAVRHAVQAARRCGQRLRLIGEPWWTARIGHGSKEWLRYESLVNVALAWANAALVCVYNTRAVGPEMLADVARTHPELVVGGHVKPSPGYLDPAIFNAECDNSPLPELPVPALRQRCDGVGKLAVVRHFMSSYAIKAGAATPDFEHFLQAVDEVAANALECGSGSAMLQVWTDPQTLICEVNNAGGGRCDPLAGRLPSGRSTALGRRLWLARQLCDLVEVRSDSTGTTVRLHWSMT